MERELKAFKESAVVFSVFLKKNSIAFYNDETLQYLDILIHEEQGKIQAGGSLERLNRISKSRKEYQQEIKTLQENLRHDPNTYRRALTREAIMARIEELFGLEYFGKI